MWRMRKIFKSVFITKIISKIFPRKILILNLFLYGHPVYKYNILHEHEHSRRRFWHFEARMPGSVIDFVLSPTLKGLNTFQLHATSLRWNPLSGRPLCVLAMAKLPEGFSPLYWGRAAETNLQTRELRKQNWKQSFQRPFRRPSRISRISG